MARVQKSPTLYSPPFSRAYWRDAAAELKDIKMLVLTALLIALRVALKPLAIPLGPQLSIQTAMLATALGAMIFGPVMAIPAAIISDTIGFIIFPTGEYFLPFVLTEIASTMIYALCLYRAKPSATRVMIARFLICFVINVVLQQFIFAWQYTYMGNPEKAKEQILGIMGIARIFKNLCMFPIEAFVLTLFLSVIIPVTYKLGLTHDPSADKSSMKFTTKQFALLLTLFAVGVGGLLTYLNYHYQTKSLSASYSTSERMEKNRLMQELIIEESDEYDNVETITIVESAYKEFFTGKITYSVAIYEVTTPLDAEQEEACWKYSKSKAKKDENLTFQEYATIAVDKAGDVVSFELN